MKRILYILSFALLAMACSRELIEPEVVKPVSDKVTIGFDVKLPDPTPATKAMADQPGGNLQNLYLAVFDETGYLTEYVQATPVLAQVNDTRYKYTANISLSKAKRIIHFIGNAPASIKFGNEETVLATIKATGDQDIYWYRKELEQISGIAPALEDQPYQPTAETMAALTEIPLIRNFAKVVLTDEADGFELISYAVINTPKSGMAAAYDTERTEFVDYFTYKDGEVTINYDNNTSQTIATTVVDKPKTYAALTTEGYDGNIPSVTEYTSITEAWAKAVGPGAPYFVYERETPVSSPAYILAYGTYGGENLYYKIDLRDNSGNYFPLLRNFEYNIILKTVSRAGYKTAEEAANSTGSGDISTALETISLVYISDGVASLEVEYTEKVVTTADPVTLDFEFITDVANGELGSVDHIRVVKNDDAGASGDAISGVSWNQANPGVVTVTPVTPTNTPKTQTITIYADYTKDGVTKVLQRTIKYVVMTRRTMTAVCVPSEVPKTRGSEFDLEITIPGGLSSSMFPLELAVEAKELTITPDNAKDHMPVESGLSISGSGSSAFYFIKTLEWDDYDPLAPSTTVVCHFKTNKDISATKIFVANPYFETASTDLGNYDPMYFTNLAYNGGATSILYGEGREVTFSFDLDSRHNLANPVYVTLNKLDPDEEKATNQLIFKYVNEATGRAVYEYWPTTEGTQTLYLLTADYSAGVEVELSSHQYIDNSASCARDEAKFANVTLSRANVGVGATSTFTFNYVNEIKGVPVTLTLTNLKPQTGDARFTENSDGTYTFQPDGTTSNNVTQSITLVATTFGTRTGVTITADGYTPQASDTVTAFRTLVVNTTLQNDISSTSDIRVCKTDPGTSWTAGSSIGQIRMSTNGAIAGQNTIELNEDITESTTYFLQHRTEMGWNTRRTYYVLELTAKQLYEGSTETLNWENIGEGGRLDW